MLGYSYPRRIQLGGDIAWYLTLPTRVPAVVSFKAAAVKYLKTRIA